MHPSRSWRRRLVLLSASAGLSLLAAPHTTTAAPPDPCKTSVFECAEATLGVDFEVDLDEVPQSITFGTRLVIYWQDGDCEYRQVVIVTVWNLPQLQDIMRPLGANEWNAAGEVSRVDFQAALRDGTLRVLFYGDPELYRCKADPLPPCELPWGEPIVIEIVTPPDDIFLASSLGPIGDPELCFSVDLDRVPVFGPMPDVMVPFFFVNTKDIGKLTRLLNER